MPVKRTPAGEAYHLKRTGKRSPEFVKDSLGREEDKLDIEAKRRALMPKPMTAKDSLNLEKLKLDIKRLEADLKPKATPAKKPTAIELQHAAIDSLVKLEKVTPVESLQLKAKIGKGTDEESTLSLAKFLVTIGIQGRESVTKHRDFEPDSIMNPQAYKEYEMLERLGLDMMRTLEPKLRSKALGLPEGVRPDSLQEPKWYERKKQ